MSGWLGTLLGGGAVAILGAITLMIRALLSKTTIDADAAGTLNAIAIAQLNAVRKDAEEQISRARADATTAVAQALADVTAARRDADQARRDAGEARREATDARRDADESTRQLRAMIAELFRPDDPARTIERLKILVNNGTANGRTI
jgi:ribosomal protein L12E/L44/L45/RPP1/RPP2